MSTAVSIFEIAARPEDRITHEIRKGVPASAFAAAAAALQLSNALLAQKLGITLRTVDRAKRDGRRLDKDMTEKLMRLARVHNMASKIFADEMAIRDWLQSPSITLSGEAPLNLLDTDSGCRQVEHLLLGLAHGHFM